MATIRVQADYARAEDNLWTATAVIDAERSIATHAGSLDEAKTRLRDGLRDLLRDGEIAEVADYVWEEEAVTE